MKIVVIQFASILRGKFRKPLKAANASAGALAVVAARLAVLAQMRRML